MRLPSNCQPGLQFSEGCTIHSQGHSCDWQASVLCRLIGGGPSFLATWFSAGLPECPHKPIMRERKRKGGEREREIKTEA